MISALGIVILILAIASTLYGCCFCLNQYADDRDFEPKNAVSYVRKKSREQFKKWTHHRRMSTEDSAVEMESAHEDGGSREGGDEEEEAERKALKDKEGKDNDNGAPPSLYPDIENQKFGDSNGAAGGGGEER